MMRIVIRSLALFLTAFPLYPMFAGDSSLSTPVDSSAPQLKVEIPEALESSQVNLMKNASAEERKGFFRYMALGLGYSQDHEILVPSSTPQTIAFSSTLTPEVFLTFGTRPLLKIGKSSFPAYILFNSNHRVSEENLVVNGKILLDRQHLFTQSLGGGFEWKFDIFPETAIGLGASLSRVGAFSTKSMRSETMSYWGERQDYALRLYHDFPVANVLIEFLRIREKLNDSSLWRNGVKIALLKQF